jgi:heme exporter protein C
MKLFRPALALCLLAIIALGLLAYGFHVAMTVPADEAMYNVQRIFYYHTPAWVLTSLCFGVNLIGSVVYLAARNKRPALALKADAVALATAEMGVIFCLVGLVTGSLWARYAWGIWWTWDERLTTTLILWLIYVSYLLLRNFSAGHQMRTIAAVLAIFGYIDVPIVYMSTRWWRTQHPAPVFFGGPGSGIADSMKPAVSWNIYAWMAWALLIVSLRYGLERRRQRIDEDAALRSLEPPTPATAAPIEALSR